MPDDWGYVVHICDHAFDGCKQLLSVYGNSWLEIDDYAFYNCEKLIAINNAITWLGKSCFSECKKLMSDVTNLMNQSSNNSRLTVPYLSEYAFYNCSAMKTITIHHPSFKRDSYDEDGGINRREPYVFYKCSGLTTIYIDPYTTVDYDKWGFVSNTFEGCTNVKKIYCNSYSPPFLGIKNIDKNCAIDPDNCDLYIPTGRTAAYNSKAQWGKFTLDHIHELTPEEFHEIRPDIW
jgi:hypothetical protein